MSDKFPHSIQSSYYLALEYTRRRLIKIDFTAHILKDRTCGSVRQSMFQHGGFFLAPKYAAPPGSTYQRCHAPLHLQISLNSPFDWWVWHRSGHVPPSVSMSSCGFSLQPQRSGGRCFIPRHIYQAKYLRYVVRRCVLDKWG